MQSVLKDWRTAPVTEKVRATLGFLEKLTLHPSDVSREDVDVVRAAGVSDAAIEDAIWVCFAFNLIDRIADALGFWVPTPEQFAQSGQMMYHGAYA